MSGKTQLSLEATRFTLDGSPELESHLRAVCDRVVVAVQSALPAGKLEALVLGGGYGRGEGGVLKTPTGDQPYNDLEFYVFLRGNRLLNERLYRRRVDAVGEMLSPQAGLHVEFKLDSLPRWRRSPVSMFSYDLVSGHRILVGKEDLFEACKHHRNPERIPLSEATRLLFNRGSGLLLAKEILQNGNPAPDQQDFIGRNLAKAQLALGDALLVVFGRYHWSGLERHKRLMDLLPGEVLPSFQAIREHHSKGLHFKLHPRRSTNSAEELKVQQRELAVLALGVWLWVESKRLDRAFWSVDDYVSARVDKCPETARWRNCLLTLRTLGPGAALGQLGRRYPRERLFNALPLLLWTGDNLYPAHLASVLQRSLHTRASDWKGLLAAYKHIWAGYG